MPSKEWREAGKQFGICIAALVIVAFTIILGNWLSEKPESFALKFFPIMQFVLLAFALISGLALFAAEKKQKGMEYLFSLPYTRMQLLICKLIPRLAVILALYFAFLAIRLCSGQEHWVFSLFSFSALYLAIYFISLSLSLFSDSFVELALFSFLMILVYICFNLVSYLALLFTPMRERFSLYARRGGILSVFIFEPDREDLWAILPIVLFLIPFLAAFVFIFRRIDVRPARTHLKKYLAVLIPGLFVSLLLSGLWIYHHNNTPGYSYYYLTRDHHLLQFDFFKTIQVYDGQNRKKITYRNVHSLYPYMEYKNSLFCRNFIEEGQETFVELIRLDIDTLAMEKVYRVNTMQRIGGVIWKWRDYLVWLEKSPEAIEPKKSRRLYELYKLTDHTLYVVLLHLPSKNVKKLEIHHPDLSSLNITSLKIIGADRINNRDFWILDCTTDKNRYLVRVWDDGTFAKLLEIRTKTFYMNHMIFLPENKSLKICSITADGIMPIKEVSGSFGFYPWMNFYYYRHDLDKSEVQEIYAKKDDQWVMIDLADFSILPVSGIKPGFDFLRLLGKEEPFLFRKTADGKTEAYRIIKNQASLIRTFDWPDFDDRNFQVLSILDSGVVVKLGKRVHVYAFPDLREIEYKGLN